LQSSDIEFTFCFVCCFYGVFPISGLYLICDVTCKDNFIQSISMQLDDKNYLY